MIGGPRFLIQRLVEFASITMQHNTVLTLSAANICEDRTHCFFLKRLESNPRVLWLSARRWISSARNESWQNVGRRRC